MWPKCSPSGPGSFKRNVCQAWLSQFLGEHRTTCGVLPSWMVSCPYRRQIPALSKSNLRAKKGGACTSNDAVIETHGNMGRQCKLWRHFPLLGGMVYIPSYSAFGGSKHQTGTWQIFVIKFIIVMMRAVNLVWFVMTWFIVGNDLQRLVRLGWFAEYMTSIFLVLFYSSRIYTIKIHQFFKSILYLNTTCTNGIGIGIGIKYLLTWPHVFTRQKCLAFLLPER